MSHTAAHGIKARFPPGWNGLIYRRRAELPAEALAAGVAAGEEAESGAILRAATVPLDLDEADFGSSVVRRMSSGDALIILLEYVVDEHLTPGEGLFEERGVPWPLKASDFRAAALQVTVSGQSGVQRFFTAGGRPFCLYVVLGSGAATTRLDAINELLDTIEIDPRSPAGA